MPNRLNIVIAGEVEEKCAFVNVERLEGGPSDNWWMATNNVGERAILYVMRYHAGGKEPDSIPNSPHTTLELIRQRHKTLAGPKFGPLLARRREVDDGTIDGVKVWNLKGKLTEGIKQLSIASLGPSIC